LHFFICLSKLLPRIYFPHVGHAYSFLLDLFGTSTLHFFICLSKLLPRIYFPHVGHVYFFLLDLFATLTLHFFICQIKLLNCIFVEHLGHICFDILNYKTLNFMFYLRRPNNCVGTKSCVFIEFFSSILVFLHQFHSLKAIGSIKICHFHPHFWLDLGSIWAHFAER